MKDEIKYGERLVKWRWIYRVLYIFEVLGWAAFLIVVVMRFINPTPQITDIGFYIGTVFCVLLFVGTLVKWRYNYLTKADQKRKMRKIESEGL